MDVIMWISESGERLGTVGILMIVIFALVYGVQPKQRWWVPGWMLTDCEDTNAELERKLWVHLDRTQTKLDNLEQIVSRESPDGGPR